MTPSFVPSVLSRRVMRSRRLAPLRFANLYDPYEMGSKRGFLLS